MIGLPFEITISQGGHEIRLPGIENEAIAYALASILQATFPDHLVEVAHNGIRTGVTI